MTQASAFDAVFRALSITYHTLYELLGIQRLDTVPQLTYRAVVEYFVTEREHVKDAAQGALVREPLEDGYMVVQVFLDAKGNLCFKDDQRTPWGRRLAVKSLDSELNDLLGDKNVVLFN